LRRVQDDVRQFGELQLPSAVHLLVPEHGPQLGVDEDEHVIEQAVGVGLPRKGEDRGDHPVGGAAAGL
jgi:hypothetical protein